MRNSRVVEVWVGLFTALGLLALLVLAMQVSSLNLFTAGESYPVKARFGNASGLKSKAPVTIAGVRVGQVGTIAIDPNTFEALVTLEIEQRYHQLPTDTGASILTAGLLGEKYVGLEPGGAPDFLKAGDELTLTQSSIVLEKLISQFLFSKAQETKP